MVEGWDLRGVDDHGHSILAMLDLRAIEIDGVCAIHSHLEDGFLLRCQFVSQATNADVHAVVQCERTPSPVSSGKKPEYTPPAKGWHGDEKLP